MTKYARILMSVAATPWAMQPEKLAAMMQILRFAAIGGKLTAEEIEHRLDAARIHPNTDKAIANRPGNIALLPLRGVISNRASMIEDVSPGAGTSVEKFTQAFRSAMANDQIKAIIIDVDSPGGNVQGVPELADEIYNARGSKPVVAQVNALCASAGYWIASACDEIVVTPSGEVGSIGVYTIHEDISQYLTQLGVKETMVSAGKYKTEGNPFEPLSDEARVALQASVDDFYGMFVDAVAKHRGATSSDVRNGYGQGRMVRAPQAVTMNMADRLGTLTDTLARWGIKLNGKTNAKAETPRLNLAKRELDLIA